MTASEEMLARREKWAEALESGKYAQTKEALRREDGFCCLGVACDLYAKENGGRWQRTTEEYAFMDKIDLLPEAVRVWLGLNKNDGSYKKNRHGHFDRTLAADNDDEMSFAEIAAIIRAAPEGLFDD